MGRAVDIVPWGRLLVPVEAVIPDLGLFRLDGVEDVVAAGQEKDGVEGLGTRGEGGSRRVDRQIGRRDPLLPQWSCSDKA